jgi:MarR family transcriptional regulator for hemolysin
VERRACPHDRRAKVVVLTPAAMPIIRKLDSVAAELRAELMDDLTAEELEVALRAMRKLRTRLDVEEPVLPVRKSA